MTVNVYSRYFSAECEYGGVRRRAALVTLCSDSEQGHITYSASVTFFPHVDDEDFAVSYDAARTQVLYEGKGRRSKKREQTKFMPSLHEHANELAASLNGTIDWECPLTEARLG